VIVLDASVLIAVLVPGDAHHAAAERLLRSTTDFVVNPVTLAEVLVAPARKGAASRVLAELAELGVTELPFPPHTALTLARLRVDTGLKLPDCCVLLTAQDQRATLASFDDRMTRAATGRVPVHPFD
jgi:predicted nucleic acid-binding protein